MGVTPISLLAKSFIRAEMQPASAHHDRARAREEGRQRMVILDADLSRVRRDRDFGRIEALVSLWVKESGRPVRPIRLTTNVPIRGNGPIRARLIQDAAALASSGLAPDTSLPRVA
ncbi:hypothetical protein [Palleronia salina]|nr:hypothetical protein [Palleronia salina]